MNRQQNHQISRPSITLSNHPSVEKQIAEEKLERVIGDSHDVLIRATSVFPLVLFKDTLTVDRSKITITRRGFFNTAEVISFRIEDILNVSANVGPFFGSIIITSRFYEANKPYTIEKFWRGDVLKIKRILQGYLIARQQKIDCSAFETKELARKLDELGKVAPEEKV